jgi:hypothetical protein
MPNVPSVRDFFRSIESAKCQTDMGLTHASGMLHAHISPCLVFVSLVHHTTLAPANTDLLIDRLLNSVASSPSRNVVPIQALSIGFTL